MKRFSILSSILLVLCLTFAKAQSDEIIPFHPEVRTGTLDNGLKYFIRNNKKPEDRVELRLVVNAGSILEDEDQLGLAHFTEHMAFNGSKNFDKNELVSYLQSVGVKFGAHLNAYTSFDETVYILPVPSDDEEILEKGLTILEDWSGGLLFESEELEKERGVVIEEWRIGQGAQMRMLEKYLPIILKDSRYAERLPIGTREVIEGFTAETIKRFYNDWYRPDLMAVVAVGDIDVDRMEQRIKAHFSKLKNPDKPRERKEFDLPDNVAPLVAVTSDPEATNILFNISFKKDAEEFKTVGQYRKMLMNNLFLSMMNQRLNDLLTTGNPPYLYATTYMGAPVGRLKTAFSGFSVAKPDDIRTGVVRMLEEIRRVQLHGFNPSELKTAKLNLMEGYERAYKEKDKTPSKAWADELVRHFLEDEPVPGITYEYEFAKKYIGEISIGEINKIVAQLITNENRVMYMTAPEKEGMTLPTTDEIVAWVKETEAKTLEPLEEKNIDSNLIKEEIQPGKVTAVKSIEPADAEELTLSNGAKVFIKKTDFKNDEIRFSAYRSGGISTAEDEAYWSASFASNIVSQSGIGDYSATDLEKALAGKSVNVSAYIGEFESGFSGVASPKDLETLLQIVHLTFTEVRKDEEAFQSLIQRNRAILSNVLANPNYYYQDQLARILSQDHLRGGGIPRVEDLDKIDHNQALEFFKTQFSSPADFDYWFVGNFEKESLIPMIEKYLGSTASNSNESQWKDRGVRPPSGALDKMLKKGSEPKSTVTIKFTDDLKYTREENYYIRSFSEVLDIKLIEILREEKGGVYGVGASGSASKKPYEHFDLTIKFPCSPDNVDSLTQAALTIIEDIQKNGVTEEDLAKVKETQRRDMEVQWKENGFWLNVLKTYHKEGYDFEKISWLDDRIEELTAKDIEAVAKKYIDTDQYIRVSLFPEEE